ncbi:hypothetical protein WJX72_007942 [[Myrmecia] bisecta]|uniref:RRM domain-containing protein n=1 Tax=[Myrmecia] bisecta TaxID=41462 RepID=A0AAW1PHQ0_9CHLO
MRGVMNGTIGSVGAIGPGPVIAGLGSERPFPCIKLRGLPFSVSEEEIQMFVDTDLLDVVLVKRGGRATGEAYVLLSNPMQIERALAKNKSYLGKRYVEVFKAKKLEYYKAVASVLEDTTLPPMAQPNGGSVTRPGSHNMSASARNQGHSAGPSQRDAPTQKPHPGMQAGNPLSSSLNRQSPISRPPVGSRGPGSNGGGSMGNRGKMQGGMAPMRGGQQGGGSMGSMGPSMMGNGSMGGHMMGNGMMDNGNMGTMQQAQDHMMQMHGGMQGGPMGAMGMGMGMGDSGSGMMPGSILKLRGLPFSANRQDVAHWFSDLPIPPVSPDRVFLANAPDGRPTGTAFVLFNNPMEAEAAQMKDRQMLGNRYVEIFAASPEEMTRMTGVGL